MSCDITIKRGDTRNCIKAVLKDATGNSVDLTGCDVNFYMVPLCGTTVIKRAAHIEDAAAGEVWFVWNTGDTDVAGVYRAEFEVVYMDGRKETFPKAVTNDIAFILHGEKNAIFKKKMERPDMPS